MAMLAKITTFRHNGLEASVWAPPYEELVKEARFRRLVMYVDLANSPDPPQPEIVIGGKGAYQRYLKEFSLALARQGIIPTGHDFKVDLKIFLFLGKENYLRWQGEIRSEETLAPLHIRGNRWRAKGKVVARLGAPLGLFVGRYNPGWEWRSLPKWEPIKENVVEEVESLDQVLKEAERLLLEVEGELDPEGDYALVSYTPNKLAWMGNTGYFFRPLTPCTVAEAEVNPRRRGR